MRVSLFVIFLLGLIVFRSQHLLAACGNNPRSITVDNPQINLEANDTLNLIAHGALGGGCDILNWPTPNPIPGHFNGQYQKPNAIAFWGDGQHSPLTINTDGTLTGSHKYTQPVTPGTSLTDRTYSMCLE
jgi:hypothetical protein